MDKKILLTGAAGFVGFHCAKALRAQGHLVIGLDNFNAYYSPTLKRERAHLLEEQGVTIVEGNIVDRPLLEKLFQEHQFTHVLHLAAQAGVRYALHHPEAYVESNLIGFVSLLEVLRLHPSTELIYASSSSVYGTNEKTPFSISDRTDQPGNLYAATKKSNELLAYSYHHLFGLQVRGLRFFTVYGPWGRPDMAYFSFAQNILRDQPIRLFNQGKMQRDFTYIDDIVQGTLAALDHSAPYGLFNLGNHTPVTVLELVSYLEEFLGKRAHKEFEESSYGEVPITYADIAHSEQELGFHPKTSLKEGLSHFVEWFKPWSALNASGR